jgi:hypothetical protein
MRKKRGSMWWSSIRWFTTFLACSVPLILLLPGFAAAGISFYAQGASWDIDHSDGSYNGPAPGTVPTPPTGYTFGEAGNFIEFETVFGPRDFSLTAGLSIGSGGSQLFSAYEGLWVAFELTSMTTVVLTGDMSRTGSAEPSLWLCKNGSCETNLFYQEISMNSPGSFLPIDAELILTPGTYIVQASNSVVVSNESAITHLNFESSELVEVPAMGPPAHLLVAAAMGFVVLWRSRRMAIRA